MLDRLASLLRLKEGEQEREFWEWFAANEARYRVFVPGGPERDALFAELTRRLGRVRRGVRFAFDAPDQTDSDDGGAQRELVLSADGNRDLFPAVRRLADAAPVSALPGWKVVAFRPRVPDLAGVALLLGETVIGADDLWLALKPRGDRIDLDLYLRGLLEASEREIQKACLLLLDYALGEYDVGTKVGALDIHALPEDPAGSGLIPYPRLPEEFDASFALQNETR